MRGKLTMETNMGHEVDFLQVGNGETSGDCIVMRYGDLHSNDPNRQYVVVIDGGFKESGDKLVKFIRERYHTNFVDAVISTHLDRDHIAGLVPVLENMNVGKLYMHMPWNHAVRNDGDYQKEAREARKSYGQASELEQLAISKGIPIVEPFAGERFDFSGTAYMQIIGPSASYYGELLGGYDHNKSELEKLLGTLGGPLTAASEVIRKIQETLDPSTETLDHVHKNTSPENNSSAVTYFNLDERHLLFTGDAGVDALHMAADYAQVNGVDLSQLHLLDIPHHGSKHNIDSRFLDRVGAASAFISATKDSKKHPSPRVLNALMRRNIAIGTTENQNIWHSFNAPARHDYSPLPAYAFVSEFGDDD